MPTLIFNLKPSDDKELTCFFCCKQNIDHEFSFIEDDSFGARRHKTIGVHLTCTTNPIYRVEIREARKEPDDQKSTNLA